MFEKEQLSQPLSSLFKPFLFSSSLIIDLLSFSYPLFPLLLSRYTSAIELSDSTSTSFSSYSIQAPELKGFKATLFSNRATAYSKLNRHSNSISDCNSALELDPNYLKALRTRARSNLADEKYEDSVRDFKRAVEEGGDESIKRELRNAEIELKKSKKKE